MGGITLYDSRKVFNRAVVSTIQTHFTEEVFQTKIRDNIASAEAPSRGLDIFRYQPKSYWAEDYLSLQRDNQQVNIDY